MVKEHLVLAPICGRRRRTGGRKRERLFAEAKGLWSNSLKEAIARSNTSTTAFPRPPLAAGEREDQWAPAVGGARAEAPANGRAALYFKGLFVEGGENEDLAAAAAAS